MKSAAEVTASVTPAQTTLLTTSLELCDADTALLTEFAKRGANELRAECRRRKATPTSQTKTAFLEAIKVAMVKDRQLEEVRAVYGPKGLKRSMSKTIACVFRLINVLFADDFVVQLSHYGDPASRYSLDTKNLGYKSEFWVDVTDAYGDGENTAFNNLFHADVAFEKVRVSEFRPHNAKKLWDIWHSILSDYRKVIMKFTKSGHNSPFGFFCAGRIDLQYLHKMTTITRPELHAVVVQLLPQEATLDTLSGDKPTPSLRPLTSKETPDKNGKRIDEIVATISKIANNTDKAMLTKRQIDYFTEDLDIKRQKNAREEEHHAHQIRTAVLIQRKKRAEFLVATQKNIMEMRATIRERLLSADSGAMTEIAEIRECIEMLEKERENCLRG